MSSFKKHPCVTKCGPGFDSAARFSSCFLPPSLPRKWAFISSTLSQAAYREGHSPECRASSTLMQPTQLGNQGEGQVKVKV